MDNESVRVAICANCGAPQEELAELGGSTRDRDDSLNDLMVECLTCHTTPTKLQCEETYRRRCGPLAQRLVQRTHNPKVVGSNPTGTTMNTF